MSSSWHVHVRVMLCKHQPEEPPTVLLPHTDEGPCGSSCACLEFHCGNPHGTTNVPSTVDITQYRRKIIKATRVTGDLFSPAKPATAVAATAVPAVACSVLSPGRDAGDGGGADTDSTVVCTVESEHDNPSGQELDTRSFSVNMVGMVVLAVCCVCCWQDAATKHLFFSTDSPSPSKFENRAKKMARLAPS